MFIVLLFVVSVHHVIVGVNHIATNVHCVHLFIQIPPLFFIMILLVFIMLLLVVGLHLLFSPFVLIIPLVLHCPSNWSFVGSRRLVVVKF